jgi:hypothetical protein
MLKNVYWWVNLELMDFVGGSKWMYGEMDSIMDSLMGWCVNVQIN